MNRFDAIQSLLGLTDKEKAQILSINQSNDPSRKYKEVWIGLGGVQSAVYATEVSVPEYLAYTTEGNGESGGTAALPASWAVIWNWRSGSSPRANVKGRGRPCIASVSDQTPRRRVWTSRCTRWRASGESRSGSPRVRIYRNPGRRGGGFYVEVSYKDGTRFSRPVRKYWGGIRYFDLYGYVALAYDAGREVLQLSAYGGLLPGVGMTAQVIHELNNEKDETIDFNAVRGAFFASRTRQKRSGRSSTRRTSFRTTRARVQSSTTATNMVKSLQESIKIYNQSKAYYDALKSVLTSSRMPGR